MRPPASLAWIFLKLGTIAFGGPASHIALMRQEFVDRRNWLTDAEFLELLGAANLVPGPTSTELAIHLGFRLGGWVGLFIAGACFILPAAILAGVLAWLYQSYGSLPQVAGVLRAVKPVVVGIILDAVRSLAQSSIRNRSTLAIAVAAFGFAALGMHQLLILVLCGAAAVVRRGSQLRVGSAALLAPTAAVAAVAAQVSLPGLFALFFKVGATVFGSGYVLLAFLQSDLVENLHWLTSKQLLDAIAAGQITPGPVFTTATFIGFLLGGVKGAAVATVAIFLPGFMWVAMSGPLIPRIRNSLMASAFLEGVTVASVALIAWVLIVMGRAALMDAVSISIGVVSFILLNRFRVSAAWLIGAAALLGLFTG